MKQGHFEKYANLVRKSAHYYSRRYNIEYEEVEAQGWLIYCQCLTDFDLTKSQFSTHLTWGLKRLNDFCKTWVRQKGILYDDDEYKTDESNYFLESLPATSENISLREFLEASADKLSSSAFDVLNWILNRTWEKKGTLKPSVALTAKKFGYSYSQSKKIWEELKMYWNDCGVSCYY